MDHAPAPSWLDRHLDSRPGWADAPADGVVIDATSLEPESALAEPPAPAGSSWLDDATIDGLADEVDQVDRIDVTDDDLAGGGSVDAEFAIPAAAPVDGDAELDLGPNLIDPFDDFVAEAEPAPTALPDPVGPEHDIVSAPEDGTTRDAPTPVPDVDVDAELEVEVAVDDAVEVDNTDAAADHDAFDTLDTLGATGDESSPDADAVTEGMGAADDRFPASGDANPGGVDTGYDAFDEFDGGTDG